jgi:hypothetical protein
VARRALKLQDLEGEAENTRTVSPAFVVEANVPSLESFSLGAGVITGPFNKLLVLKYMPPYFNTDFSDGSNLPKTFRHNSHECGCPLESQTIIGARESSQTSLHARRSKRLYAMAHWSVRYEFRNKSSLAFLLKLCNQMFDLCHVLLACLRFAHL